MYKVREALSSQPDIDHEIIDWLAAINSYRGVCTLNSCAGHTDKEGKGEPFVVMYFFNGSSFYSFCKALSPVGHKSSPMLVLWPESKMIMVSVLKVPPDRLPSRRNALFERIISTLEKVIKRKAGVKEIDLKTKMLRDHK